MSLASMLGLWFIASVGGAWVFAGAAAPPPCPPGRRALYLRVGLVHFAVVILCTLRIMGLR